MLHHAPHMIAPCSTHQQTILLVQCQQLSQKVPLPDKSYCPKSFLSPKKSLVPKRSLSPNFPPEKHLLPEKSLLPKKSFPPGKSLPPKKSLSPEKLLSQKLLFIIAADAIRSQPCSFLSLTFLYLNVLSVFLLKYEAISFVSLCTMILLCIFSMFSFEAESKSLLHPFPFPPISWFFGFGLDFLSNRGPLQRHLVHFRAQSSISRHRSPKRHKIACLCFEKNWASGTVRPCYCFKADRELDKS